MIFVMSFIAIKKRVPLSGEPWDMSFSWECIADMLYRAYFDVSTWGLR